MTIAYGFIGIQHLFSTRVQQAGPQRIFTAIQETAAEHNRVINSLMASLVEPTTIAQEQFELPAGGTLQPLDEWGVPIPVKHSGSYQVGYPIQGGGTAWGTNRVSAAYMTVAETNREVTEAQTKDADWLRRHIMAALLDKTAWTYNDVVGPDGSKGLGNITIQPLANNDSVTYLRVGGTTSTDNHYLGQAAAIADAANPFPTIYDELMEHPSNSGPVVVYVATSLTTTIEALANFTPVSDPDIRIAADTDELVGNLSLGFGDEVLGKVDKCWIVEWKALPSGYMIAHAQGAGPVLKMRQHVPEELQGLFPENHSPDGNRKQMSLIRYAGFGVSNRVGALCYYIGNATYPTPAAYDAPLAV